MHNYIPQELLSTKGRTENIWKQHSNWKKPKYISVAIERHIAIAGNDIQYIQRRNG